MTTLRSTRSLLITLVAAAVLTGSLALTPNAGAAATATVAGILTYADGITPVPSTGVELCASAVAPPPGSYGCNGAFGTFTRAAAITGPDGTYTFSAQSAGPHQLVVFGPSATGDQYAVFTIGNAFTVLDGATMTENLSLARGGKVSGTVTAGGAPVSTGVRICPTGYPPTFCQNTTSAGDGTYISQSALPGPSTGD